ncbi:MAG: sulfatase-like hydrolase/transferase [Chloroflexi bacterium]|nr:sulfatase-like hydrolase/transferase [Chloroflexota bacterium]
MPRNRRLNVVLISVDTLRADHLSCYGYSRLTSPHVDGMASRGTRFLQCTSPHIPTHPGHTTMLTGRDAVSHQIICHGGDVELAAEIPTLAELLQAQGYYTAAADNLQRWFVRGFTDYQTYEWERPSQGPWRKAEGVHRAAAAVLDRAVQSGQPFFLFIHYWDPHTPYFPPPPFDRLFYGGDPSDPHQHGMEEVLQLGPFRQVWGRWWGHVTDIQYPVAEYDGAIAYWDATFASFIERLAALGVADETVVVLTADHGEELTEHQMWFDHHGLYETNVHVPLILWGPGIPAGQVVEDSVATFDIMPTILDLTGLSLPTLDTDGRSLVPLLQGVSLPPREYLILTECSWMRKRAVRTPRWKAIFSLEPDFHNRPPVELYDLLIDSSEQENLAECCPAVVETLRQVLERWLRERTETTGQPDPFSYQDLSVQRAREELARQGKRQHSERIRYR